MLGTIVRGWTCSGWSGSFRDGTLELVHQRGGKIYDYFGVPMETYRALLDAESKDAFIQRVLQPNFDDVRAEFPIG